MSAPQLGRISRHAGIAGQYAYTVPVTYPGEITRVITFVANVYGGPTFVMWDGVATRVAEPERFGPSLCESWVRRYYGEAP